MDKSAETTQNNMRTYIEDKEEFAAFCRKNNLKQADAFAAAVQALKLSVTKRITPEREAEINEVQQALELVMNKYNDSIRYASTAENRVRQEFSQKAAEKETARQKLQEKVQQLTDQLKYLEEAIKNEKISRAQAEAKVLAADKAQKTAEKQLKEKQKVNDLLTVKLAEAEDKTKNYDELAKKYQALQQAANQQLQQSAQETHQNADLTIEKLQNQLNLAKQTAQAAQQVALAKSQTASAAKITSLTEKLNQRTDQVLKLSEDLAKAKEEVQALQKQLQTSQKKEESKN